MKIAVTVARILLGLVFLAAGVSGFFLINAAPPPMPGDAGAFQDVIFHSRFVLFVDAMEAIAGLLLIANLFAPLALIAIAALIYNILAFHVTMMISGIAPGIVAAILWVVVAQSYRPAFEPLLKVKFRPQ